MGNPKRPGGSDQVATVGAIVVKGETRGQGKQVDHQGCGRCGQGRPPAVATAVRGIRGNGKMGWLLFLHDNAPDPEQSCPPWNCKGRTTALYHARKIPSNHVAATCRRAGYERLAADHSLRE